MADVQTKFKAALDVIQSLPKDGPYRPAPNMLLMFYAYYKQATEGPCNKPKPWAFDVINKAKWEAWNKLGSMTQETAMDNYVQELTKIIEVLPSTSESTNFIQNLGNFYEVVDAKHPEVEKLKRRFADESNGDQPIPHLNGNHVHTNGHVPAEKEMTDHVTSDMNINKSSEEIVEEDEITHVVDVKSESDDEFCDTSTDVVVIPKNYSISGSDASSLSTESLSGSPNKSGDISAVDQLLDMEQSQPPVDGGERGTRGRDSSRKPRGKGTVTTPGSSTYPQMPENPSDQRMQGGSGGSGDPWQNQADKHAEIEERIAVVLLQLQRDMHSVLNRLSTLETIIMTRQQDSQHCHHCCLHRGNQKGESAPVWWPFPEIHPKTALFFIIWPFLAKIILEFLRRHARKRR